MELNKLASSIISLAAVISLAFGSYFYFEKRYALAGDLEKVKSRLEYKIKSDQLKSTQDRIWTIEDRYQGKPMDKTTTEELRQLKESKDQIKGELDKLEKQK